MKTTKATFARPERMPKGWASTVADMVPVEKMPNEKKPAASTIYQTYRKLCEKQALTETELVIADSIIELLQQYKREQERKHRDFLNTINTFLL
jgi:hypothetical protein